MPQRSSGKGNIEYIDDFGGPDFINTSAANGIMWLISSDSGDTAFAQGTANGNDIVQGIVTTTDNNMIEIAHHLLMWRAQDGLVGMEVRMALDGITTTAFTVGLNDDQVEDSNTLPVELSTLTFTSNASTFIGVVYDTNATNDDIHAFWVDDDSDASTAIATLRFTGLAPNASAANYYTYKVELWDQGAGNQARSQISIINHLGRLYQKTFSSTVDRDALLTPHVGLEQRSTTAARTMDIDYIQVWKARG